MLLLLLLFVVVVVVVVAIVSLVVFLFGLLEFFVCLLTSKQHVSVYKTVTVKCCLNERIIVSFQEVLSTVTDRRQFVRDKRPLCCT